MSISIPRKVKHSVGISSLLTATGICSHQKSQTIFVDPLHTALRLEELRLRNHLAHSSAPAIAVNTLGAERSPKGSTTSTYSPSSQTMPNSTRSSGCTGTILYTFLMSIFASFDPCPDSTMALAASLILV